MSTLTTNKALIIPAHGEFVNSWDTSAANLDFTAVDTALGGSTLLNFTALSGDQTLTSTQYIPLSLLVSGAPAGNTRIVIPSGVGGQWVVRNDTTGSFTLTIASAAGGSNLTIPAAAATIVSCDGSSSGMRFSVSTAATAAGSNTQIQFNNAGSFGASANLVWTGTSLGTTGFVAAGNAVLGLNSGSTLQIVGTALSAPNGLAINTTSLVIGTNTLGVGTAPVAGDTITAAGVIHSTAGGIKFPDGTTQTTATVGAGAGGSNTQVQYNNSGAFAGSANMTFNGTTLTAAGLSSSGALAVTGTGTLGALSVSGATSLATLATSGAASLNSASVTNTATIANLVVTAGTTIGNLISSGVGYFSMAPGAGAVRFFQNTTDTPGFGNGTPGASMQSAADGGALFLSRTGLSPSLVLNANSDTQVAGFYRNGNQVGSISITVSATAFNTSSARALKRDFAPIEDAIEIVKAIRGHRFKWKADGSDDVGFVYEDVVKVLPTAARVEGQVNYAGAIPVLCAAIEQLVARVEHLEAR